MAGSGFGCHGGGCGVGFHRIVSIFNIMKTPTLLVHAGCCCFVFGFSNWGVCFHNYH